MGWSYFKEVEVCDDTAKVEFKPDYISIEMIYASDYILLNKENAEEFIEALICACKCANIELINVGYK